MDCNTRTGFPTLVRFDASGKRLFVIDKHVTVLAAATGAELGGFDLTFRRYDTVYNAVVSPDGRWLALRGGDGMQVRDTTDGRLALEDPSVHYGYSLAFTPDGSQLALDSGNQQIDFWDVGTWRRGSSLNPGIGTATALAFSTDGLLGAAGGYQGQVALWDRE